jgi:dipeptidyl aminopeptidase/acylaminoacyl peptidase
MDTDGSNPTNLTNNSSYDHSPTFSPDGTRIAFVSNRGSSPGANSGIYVMDADSTSQTSLISGWGGYDVPSLDNPAWSPDGTKIAFEEENWAWGGFGTIRVVDASDGTEITRPTSSYSISIADSRSLDWGPCYGVCSVKPAESATRVPRSTNVAATFSTEMDPSTLNTSTVTLVKEGTTTPVSATVRYDEATQTVKLNPSERLARKKTYMVTIEGAADGDGLAVKDMSGDELAQDFVWSFTTGRK